MSEELLNKQTDRHPIALENRLIRCQKVIIVCKLISQIGLAVLELLRDTHTHRQTDKNPYYFVVLISLVICPDKQTDGQIDRQQDREIDR